MKTILRIFLEKYVQLYHEQKFSKKEFEGMVVKATADVLKKRKTKKGDFGFKKVEFDANFSVFGWANIFDKKDWKYDRDEQLNLLTNAITAEILK